MGEHPNKVVRRNPLTTVEAAARGRSLLEREAEALKSLAHPKRLLLLDLLSDGEERSVGELVELTGIRQSNVSQNLALLRAAGLVLARRESQLIYYRISDPLIVRAVSTFRAVMHARIQDPIFQEEQTALRKEKTLRRTAMSAFVALSGILVTALLAVMHPVLSGGTWADAASHTVALLGGNGIGDLLMMCLAV